MSATRRFVSICYVALIFGVRLREVLSKEQVEEFADLIAWQLPRLTYDLLHCHGHVFENAGLSGVGNFRGR